MTLTKWPWGFRSSPALGMKPLAREVSPASGNQLALRKNWHVRVGFGFFFFLFSVRLCTCVCVHAFGLEATFKSLFEFVASRLSVREAQAADQMVPSSLWPFTSHTSTRLSSPASLSLPSLDSDCSPHDGRIKCSTRFLCCVEALDCRGFFFFPFSLREKKSFGGHVCLLHIRVNRTYFWISFFN